MLRILFVLVLLAPAGLLVCCGGSSRAQRKARPSDGPGFDPASPAWESAQVLTRFCKDSMSRASAHREALVAIGEGKGEGDALESYN